LFQSNFPHPATAGCWQSHNPAIAKDFDYGFIAKEVSASSNQLHQFLSLKPQ
jgi:hypothetical protein